MSRFLVKYRKGIFALMAVLVAACALMVPRISINTDMTQYMETMTATAVRNNLFILCVISLLHVTK